MEQINKKQNNVIIQIDEILNKMSNQVKFLIRNEKLMNQLDVDLLMENTRKLYDTLCSVKFDEEIEGLEGLEEIEGVEGDEVFEELEDLEDEEVFEDNEDLEDEEEFEDNVDLEDEEVFEGIEEIEGVEDEEEFEDNEDLEDNDEFENDEEIEEIEEFEEDEEIEDDEEIEEEVEEIQNPIPSPSPSPIPSPSPDLEDSGIRAYKKVYTVESQTLGDKLESVEDRSLAARLQRKPVTDLMNAIGINDKFLLLNELFGGSMEKYNKSIRALNSFSTLLGAKTYMSELQIEFQWDCESEAYKKLDALVERRFIPIHNA